MTKNKIAFWVFALVVTTCAMTRAGETWFTTEYMLLRRSTSDVSVLQHRNGTGGAADNFKLLDAHSLHSGLSHGMRYTLGHELEEGCDISLTYFGMLMNSGTKVINNSGELDFGFGDSGSLDDLDDADTAIAFYDSEFHNAELNVEIDSEASENLSWLVGLRLFSLNENFYLNLEDNGSGGSDYRIRTRNLLLGPQAGMSWNKRLNDRLAIGVTSKAGVFANFAKESVFLGEEVTPTIRSYKDQTHRVSFVTDIEAKLACRVTDCFFVHAGYFLMFAHGVALAPEQHDLDRTNVTVFGGDGGNKFNTDNDTLYHGWTFGGTFLY